MCTIIIRKQKASYYSWLKKITIINRKYFNKSNFNLDLLSIHSNIIFC